jgi:CheY-like chemotaxis protein
MVPEAHSPERAVSSRSPELRDLRILIVDDDPQASTLIEMALTEARFRSILDVATTAAEGLRRIQDWAHDVRSS